MLNKLRISIEASVNVFLRKPATPLKCLLGLPLFLLSILYIAILFFKKWLYDFQILHKSRTPIFTISIGNVTVGGSGKTPFTLYLARQLEKQTKLAIISRGYKSRVERTKEALIVKESGVIKCSAADCGDEPYLLAGKTESALVIAGPDRLKNLQLACEKGANVALLDDAMQNFSIKKDADILLINAKDLFGQQQFLPFGLFREPLSAMARCSMVVVNQVHTQELAEKCEQKLRKYFSGDIVCVSMQIDTCLYSAEGSEEVSCLQGQNILALAGIADPLLFKKQLTETGFVPKEFLAFSDHQVFDHALVKEINQLAKDKKLTAIVCTEKDWVKLKDFIFEVPLFYLPLRVKFIKGKQFVDRFIASTLGFKR